MDSQQERFRNAFLFLAKAAEHPTLGKVKLAKMLFLADALAYEKLGSTITNRDYIKLPLGPVPVDYDFEIDSMENDGLIKRQFRSTQKNIQEYYTVLKRANLNIFSKEEKTILQKTVSIFLEYFTGMVVDLSHKLLPWDIIELKEIISFELLGMDCKKALKLKSKKSKLSITDLILESDDLMKSFRKGQQDVRRSRIKEHTWR